MSDVHGSCPCSTRTHTRTHTQTHLHVSTLVVPGRRFVGAPEGEKACQIVSLSLSRETQRAATVTQTEGVKVMMIFITM